MNGVAQSMCEARGNLMRELNDKCAVVLDELETDSLIHSATGIAYYHDYTVAWYSAGVFLDRATKAQHVEHVDEDE